MTIRVDKSIPIPKSNGMMATIRDLEVGESFRLPKGSNRNSPHSCAQVAKIKVTVKKQKDGSFRVWRTK